MKAESTIEKGIEIMSTKVFIYNVPNDQNQTGYVLTDEGRIICEFNGDAIDMMRNRLVMAAINIFYPSGTGVEVAVIDEETKKFNPCAFRDFLIALEKNYSVCTNFDDSDTDPSELGGDAWDNHQANIEARQEQKILEKEFYNS